MTAVLLDGMRLVWFHPPNGAYLGGSNRARAGAQMKSQGLKAGVPDVVILTPAPTNGKPCFIELKTKTGRLSHDQLVWRDKLIELGYNWALCRHVDDVLSILDEWGFDVIPKKNPMLRPHPMQLTLT
jgi:hypothetical protein